MITMALLTILGPLAAVVLILGLRATRWSAFAGVSGAGVGLVGALVSLLNTQGQPQGSYSTLLLPGLPGLPLRLVLNPLSALLSTVVAVVSTLVFLYAAGYMGEEAGQRRFWAGMSFFVAAMQILVLAGDWLLLLAAWELIGLASYLLIGFWYDRPGVREAATRAFLTTRAADFGLYLAVFALVSQAGTTEISTLPIGSSPLTTVAGLGLLLAAMGKSAQLPFQGWLQAAMAGPTPVSALLHSATLVAAGPILLVRGYAVLDTTVLLLAGLIGGITAVVAGLSALAQDDLKRMLAASTSSQLGFMLLALGAGSVGAAVGHLVTHAAMKSALFLGAGLFQHAYHSTSFAQIRAAGGGRRYPLVFAGFTVAALALAGVPPLAGFWSKDAIIAATFNSPNAPLLAPLALLGTLLTGLYLGRGLRLLWPPPVSNSPAGPGISKSTQTRLMIFALLGLALLAAGLGLVLRPIGELLAQEIPESELALVASLVMALAGLALGWFRAAGWFSLDAGWQNWARNNFLLFGGWDRVVVGPALAVAGLTSRLDQQLHRRGLAVGYLAGRLAQLVNRLDNLVHALVTATGRGNLSLARLSRQADEQGIDKLIAGLVSRTQSLGQQARRLQSGLVHRELLLTTGAVVMLVVLLVVTR